MVDSTGNKVVEYTYGAWGDILSISGSMADTIGQKNPLRYRGYYYDAETGLYYVSSRYYDPEIGRFVNADSVLDNRGVNTLNLFAYCGNNPIVRIDVTGYVWESVFDIATLGASVIEVVSNPSDPWAWAGLIGDAVDLIPFVTGVGEVTRTVKVVNKVDDVVDVAKNTKKIDTGVNLTKKIHGNSLKSNKMNYGYALLDENKNILKFGETINPTRRYTKKYLSSNGYTMKVLDFGSKKYIHDWQFDMNMNYYYKYKVLPPLNKKGW